MPRRTERHRLIVDDLQTSYLIAGADSAPPVVLLHDGAWGGSARASWDAIIPHLAEYYRVIAPDLFGYGDSSKVVQLDVAPYEFRLRQVAGLLDALGLRDRRAHIVGNSFGGAMALRASTIDWFAWRMRSATSIAGTGGPFRTKESLVSLAHFDGSGADMRRIVLLLTGEFDGLDEYVDLRLQDASNPGHYRAVAAAGLATPFATTVGTDPYPASLASATMPITLVSGRNDDLVERDWAQQIAAHAPSCSVREIDGRHSPNISDPGQTAELLVDILVEHEQRELQNGASGSTGTSRQ
ncbi:MAG: alpha/beta hydrolase [Actinobacteria bacterium]|nr:alpha/beta hydrolase [Actinomycetota bacterium]